MARRLVPAEARLKVVLLRRGVRDRRRGVCFASQRAPVDDFGFQWAEYSRPFLDYPGQEQLAGAKRQNKRVLAAALDGVVIDPGQVFSVWQLAGRPTSGLGYAPAAALKDGQLIRETGGAICLLSTVLYNVGLLAGLEVVERKCHSVDSYGAARYFELGRDAAIEFGYVDLRFRNSHPERLRLGVVVSEDEVTARLCAASAKPFTVDLGCDTA